MATVPHVQTPTQILDQVEAVLRDRPAGLRPARVEFLIAQRLGAALPTELSIVNVLEELIQSGRAEWVSSSRGPWSVRLLGGNEVAPRLPAGTASFEAHAASPLADANYVNQFPYRQIDVLSDGRVLLSAVSLSRSAAADHARTWVHDNELARETRIERNLGDGKWGVTDSFVRVGHDTPTVRHFDVVATQMRLQRAEREANAPPKGPASELS